VLFLDGSSWSYANSDERIQSRVYARDWIFSMDLLRNICSICGNSIGFLFERYTSSRLSCPVLLVVFVFHFLLFHYLLLLVSLLRFFWLSRVDYFSFLSYYLLLLVFLARFFWLSSRSILILVLSLFFTSPVTVVLLVVESTNCLSCLSLSSSRLPCPVLLVVEAIHYNLGEEVLLF
jgi:hypothetical protein